MKKLEAAIPAHLRVPRTRPLGADETFKPVSPSFSARFDPDVVTLVMAYFGVQYRVETEQAIAAVDRLKQGFSAPHKPSFWDMASYVDEAEYTNVIVVGYWDDAQEFHRWQTGLTPDWWHADASLDGDLGFFKECYTPGIADTETTFSHPYPEGYSKIARGMSGETDTHGYWGSARDRLPRAQTEALEPTAALKAGSEIRPETRGRLVSIAPHENLCLLRSGQDWSDTEQQERDFYLREVKPFLDRGMLEIRDGGAGIGCFFNRYMTLLTEQGSTDKTYSLSAWHSLAAIEEWVQKETHLAIFRAGIQHYKTAGEGYKLRLYHEMSVLRACDQQFEYFNCHRQTGMLNSV
ncbi:phenylacetaldoxime dehydratase family protein [Sneathiella marina]|uniref:Phenylacetaldoxime dehydratase family protein n=1 Tax=Sneathiella marina TaxID=2950108 RepID=A0ABY4W4F4_9PROT|nr:phenylacetaldoxime dehydratase family protein [Sneathiella marina]USG60998.1 phenylacetaldoxime dehydratase family protein [Sneathiella marina]